MSLNSLILIFVGSGLGGCLRFGLGFWIRNALAPNFPIGTLIINLMACTLAGVLVGKFLLLNTDHLRFFLLIGFCGGFSTFSAFSVETLELFENGSWGLASLYIGISVFAGIGAVWLGKIIAS